MTKSRTSGAVCQLSAISYQQSAFSRQLERKGERQIQHPLLPKFPAFGGGRKEKGKSNLKSISPQIPCLRRVPFEATKRNQKSPPGAGPVICTARISSRDAHDPLPCQRLRITMLRDGRNRAPCFDLAPEWHRDRNLRGFVRARSKQRSSKTG